jgi:ribosomal protein S18 acetylase RimI-like enzyme
MIISRPAEAGDLLAIAQFHVDVWKETYRTLMDLDFLEGLSVGQRQKEWEGLFMEWPTYRIFVAEDVEKKFLGFASVREHDDQGFLALELHTLNLKPEARGTGLARRMMDDLLSRRPAFLWVVEGNARAVEFYQRAGFLLTDERRPDLESQVDDLRMVRSPGVEDAAR